MHFMCTMCMLYNDTPNPRIKSIIYILEGQKYMRDTGMYDLKAAI